MKNFKRWFFVNEAITTIDAGSPEHTAIMQKLNGIDTRVKNLDVFLRELEDNLYLAFKDLKNEPETKRPQTPLKIIGYDPRKKSA